MRSPFALQRHSAVMARALLLVMCLLLASCFGGGGGDDNPRTDTADSTAPPVTPSSDAVILNRVGRSHVIVSPSAALLERGGTPKQLRASFISDSGQEEPGTVRWISNKPDVVAVDQNGVVTPVGSWGSALVTAEIKGVTSAPVLVTVASPAPAAVLVSDAQILEDPTPEDPQAVYAVGYRYKVRLQDIPNLVPGNLVIGTEEITLAGRVVDVRREENQTIATVAIVPLNELFRELHIDEIIPLTRADVLLSDNVREESDVRFGPSGEIVITSNERPASGPAIAQAPVSAILQEKRLLATAAPLGDGKFKLGKFECELPPLASVDLNGPYRYEIVSDGISLPLKIDVVGSNLPTFKFGVAGNVGVKKAVDLDATLAANSGLSCEINGPPRIIPAPGYLRIFIGGLVTVGAGFDVSLGGQAGKAGWKFEADVVQQFDMGFEYQLFGAGWRQYNDSVPLTTNFKSELKPLEGARRLDGGIGVAGKAKVTLVNPILYSVRQLARWLRAIELNVLNVKAGPVTQVSASTVGFQMADRNYASNYRMALDAKITAGMDALEWGKLLGITNPLNLSITLSRPLGTSPKALSAISDRESLETGVPIAVTVNLDQATTAFPIWPSTANVDQIELYRLDTGAKLASAVGEIGRSQYILSFVPNSNGAIRDNLFAFAITPLGEYIPVELASVAPALAPPPPPPQASCGTPRFDRVEFQNSRPTSFVYLRLTCVNPPIFAEAVIERVLNTPTGEQRTVESKSGEWEFFLDSVSVGLIPVDSIDTNIPWISQTHTYTVTMPDGSKVTRSATWRP